MREIERLTATNHHHHRANSFNKAWQPHLPSSHSDDGVRTNLLFTMSNRTSGWLFGSKPQIFIERLWRLKHILSTANQEVGGAGRDRTDDILLAKQALSQLSYGP
jgi:hypothetical protein